VAEFLLEIGCEEMPASWLRGTTEQLRQRFTDIAGRERLEPEAVLACSTPRRLALAATVVDRQAAREEQVFGPSLRAAKDASGKWTTAAEGFARKNNVAPGDLGQAAKDPARPDDLSLVFLRKIAGRDSADVLPAVIGSVLRALAFPKRMSWDAWIDDGKGAFPFGRPIRWVVALVGGQVVPFAIHAMADGAKGPVIVQTGTQTFGHRFLPREAAGRPLDVASFDAYKQTLAGHFVLVDPAAREARIREGLRSATADSIVHDELVSEWRDLVEFPTVLVGRVPDEFVTLPDEVLDTVLVHHQKYIPLRGSGSRGVRFAAVVDGDGANAQEIVRGMERVVVARLRDAAFFFAEDRKRPLADRVADLEGVVFHQGLGTYKDKAERMVRLVDAMATGMGLLGTDEHASAREAALLAKADLTTLMVREFPELQGTMGGIYLGTEGPARADVARAVRWHYHPLSIEEAAPPKGNLEGSQASVFGAVSLADKLDTLAGYFGLGLIPSGSSDPYGLRRAAQGGVRVLVDFWPGGPGARRPSLARLIEGAVEGYADRFKRPAAEIVGELRGFLADRLEYVLSSRGFPAEEVSAVVHTPAVDALEDPYDVHLRLQALHRARADAREDFEHLAVAFKRAKNILSQAPAGPVDAGLLQEPAERELHAAVGRLGARDGSYEDRLRDLAGLRAPVDRFFDDVLVMAEDAKLRANRLGLLHQTVSLFYRIADISKLGGTI
jgi:glycyl-tRNA synthetase beta chain